MYFYVGIESRCEVKKISEAARQERATYMRMYMRTYRKEHPEKTRKYNQDYWERVAQKKAGESRGNEGNTGS